MGQGDQSSRNTAGSKGQSFELGVDCGAKEIRAAGTQPALLARVMNWLYEAKEIRAAGSEPARLTRV